jgi:hypothetical protein
VTIDGLNFDSDASKPIAIGIGGGSTDVRLRNLNLTGGSAGIMIFENSQVSIARVKIRDAGWASLAIYDKSDTHVEDCLFYDDTGIGWHRGIDVGTGHLTIHRTTIRNMNVGVTVTDGGVMDVNDFNAYYPLTNVSDVVIDNPTGLPSNGIVVDSGAALQVASAKLRINGSGRDSIIVSNGSVLNATANLLISGSRGQGILVMNDSHATFDGSSITGGLHGGLVTVNNSTISANTWDKITSVSGNAVDLFCDSNSWITGAVHIANTNVVQCDNVLPYDTVPLP